MADGYSNFTPRRFFARSQSQRDSTPYRPREGLYDQSDVMYLVDETNTVHEEENELCFGLGNTCSSRSPLTSSSNLNGSMIETPQSLNVTSTCQDDVRVLLQQQQRLLLKVLSQQDEMKQNISDTSFSDSYLEISTNKYYTRGYPDLKMRCILNLSVVANCQ